MVMWKGYTGRELAKVLIYYGIINDIISSVFNIVCPFHDDINPSMNIDLDKGKFLCYGCGVSGDAYGFVKMANPKLNDLQACVLLEKILHSEEITKLNIKFKKKRRATRRQALIEAKDYFYGLRSTDWNNLRDEDERKVMEYMRNRGFNERALNVVDCRFNYDIAYPFVFPLLDNGEFKGWVGRTTNKYVEKRQKYNYNSGFNKRDTLCGNYGKNSIPFIGEGFFDYLSLRTKGHVKNSVALLGWHASDEQIKKLKDSGVKTVVSALDNDSAGNKGTENLKKFFDVIRFEYPKNIKDTGEMTELEMKKAIYRTKKKIQNNS